MAAMGELDGMGALESRIEEARRKRANEERAAASASALEAVARQAELAVQAQESANLVQEFIARAKRLGIEPRHRIPGSVEVTRSVNAGGGGSLHSERYLDRTMTRCWHLGGELPKGGATKAYPAGTSFHYLLSEAGRNLVPQVTQGPTGYAFFKAEKRIKATVTWVPRTPHINDVVKIVGPWDGPRQELTLVDAMVAFFQDHGQG